MDDKKKYLNPDAEIIELPNIDTLLESAEAAMEGEDMPNE